MSRLTLALLVAFVGALAFLAWRQTRLDEAWQRDSDVPLFSGIDAGAVQSVRIDNTPRALQMRFDRDPSVGWMMVDPMRVRAENGVIEALVTSVLARRGTPVPEAEAGDLEKLGLLPARVVLELVTTTGAKQAIRVGAPDLDRNRVHVLVGDKVLRAVRDFDVYLDFQLDEYQSHSATALDPRDVVELHRRGRITPGAGAESLDVLLDALFEDGQWRASAPFQALLDPVSMVFLAQGAAGLRFDHVVPTGGASLASLGLDPPAVTLELVTARGARCTLAFGLADQKRPDQWNGIASGDPTVFRVSADVVMALSASAVDLLDHQFERIERSEIDRIQLSSQRGEVLLQHSIAGFGVSEANPGSTVFGPPLQADPKRVEEFLGKLEAARVRAFDPAARQLAPEERAERIQITAQSGFTVSGTFGHAAETGGVRFQREGDLVLGIVDESFRDLARRSAQSFWSTTILETTEIAVVRLAISRGGKERVFERDRAGLWVEKGRTGEAKELHPLLDPLLFLRAKMHLPSLAPNIVDPIQVRWTLSQAEQTLVFGRVPLDGAETAVCDFEGRRSVLERPDLVDRLARLFEP